MTNTQFITSVVIAAAFVAVIRVLYIIRKRKKDRLVKLNCEFCISEDTDTLLDTYRKQTGVDIDGILGNDFMTRNDYIIDYESLTVRHKSVKISIKDTMNILELPLIALWQKGRKYIFLLDTGATASLIHSEETESGMDYETIDEESVLYGIGGSAKSSSMIKTSLNYYTDGKPKHK